jgi:hypothetical protein
MLHKSAPCFLMVTPRELKTSPGVRILMLNVVATNTTTLFFR